jgi:Tol biopolymer transport system component
MENSLVEQRFSKQNILIEYGNQGDQGGGSRCSSYQRRTSWSPDGKWVALAVQGNDAYSGQIMLLNSRNGDRRIYLNSQMK